jgi:hypothetical protein
MSLSPLQNSSNPSPVPGPSTLMATSGFSSLKSSATSPVMGSTVDDPEMKRLPVSPAASAPPPFPPHAAATRASAANGTVAASRFVLPVMLFPPHIPAAVSR